MNQNLPNYDSAEELRKSERYDAAAEQFAILWKRQPSAMIGWRWAYCLRKLGQLEQAEQIAQMAVAAFPADKWSLNELIWVLYDRDLKPAREANDLGRVLQAASKIMALNPEGLALARVVLAVMKVAKERGKWEIVREWSDKVKPQDLKDEANIFDGKKGMSDRETWYVTRSRAFLELGQFTAARQLALEGRGVFSDDVFLARTAALALAQSGDVAGGATELRLLLQNRHADWYVKSDLAELELKLGNIEEAYRLTCDALLTSQEDEYKIRCFVTLAYIALSLGKLDVAAEHIALARVIRERNNWSIPSELTEIERDTRSALQAQGLSWPDLSKDEKQLSRLCHRHWRDGATEGLEKHTGVVKPFPSDRDYAFIARDDGGEDVYVKLRDLPRDCAKSGARVEFVLKKSFDRKKNRDSFQAVHVRPASR